MSDTATSSLDSAMSRARTLVPPPPVPAAAAPALADELDEVLAEAAPASIGEQPKPAAAEAAPAPVAEQPKLVVAEHFDLNDSDILTASSSLVLFDALEQAVGRRSFSVFKVAALQSGYTAEIAPLAFEDIARLLASSTDAHAARIKLLRTIYSRIKSFSCTKPKFADWLKITAQGDYDTLMYGLYAASYPGENEFDVACRHCGHDNKLVADVGSLIRVESDAAYDEVKKLLDPNLNGDDALKKSLVGHIVRRRLPESGIGVEIRNPSLQDYLDGVQWFVQMQDKNTGMLPAEIAGAETIRTLTMYATRLLVPQPGTSKFLPVSDQAARASAIGRLSPTDGRALTDAVDAEAKRLDISYALPAYNCPACGKKNENLFLDFETLLFIKMREKA